MASSIQEKGIAKPVEVEKDHLAGSDGSTLDGNDGSIEQQHQGLEKSPGTTPGKETPDEEDDIESHYLRGPKLIVVVLGLCLAVLLVGLDNSILSTAIPTITTAFNSLQDVGWYGSSFLIAVCALQPISGKLYTYFSLKWTYLAFLAVFEFGSLICATAVNSVMLIIGRAIAGAGTAGLFSGALVIVGHSIPLRQRPSQLTPVTATAVNIVLTIVVYTGLIASMFAISNIVGPVLGGAFTENISWRWCFYINLPLGAVTAIILVFFFQIPDRAPMKLPLKEKLSHMDLPGLLMFIPAVVMLLLAVQWGGHDYEWKSATIIGLIVGFAVLISLFGAWQWKQQDEASIPPRILRQRSVWSAGGILFFGLGAAAVVNNFLLIWFQVVKGDTPVRSAIRFLPTVIANTLASLVSGGLVTAYGYFNPWLFFGSTVIAVSCGIFGSWEVDTGNTMIIGIQILFGVGLPQMIQMPLIGLMSILPEADLAMATSVAMFLQFFGGAIFFAIGENIFVSGLKRALAELAPDVDAVAVVVAGATGLHKVVSDANISKVVAAYNVGLTETFYLGAAGGVAAFIFSFGMKWKSVKGKQATSEA